MTRGTRGVRLVVASTLTAAAWARADAQTSDSAAAARIRPAATFGVWTAGARDEPLSTRVGHTHNRDLYAIGVRGAWPLSRGEVTRLEYTADVIPAIVSTEMPTYAEARRVLRCRPSMDSCAEPLPASETPEALASGRSVYGVALVPAGIQLRVAVAPRLSLLARAAAGVVWFERRVPDPRETQLNFWGDVGAGAELAVGGALALGAAFRLNHVSNADFGPVNPGMNTRLVELGVSWRR
jgi:Lipid A 3-O-deacylase (PagL)